MIAVIVMIHGIRCSQDKRFFRLLSTLKRLDHFTGVIYRRKPKPKEESPCPALTAQGKPSTPPDL